VPTGARAHTHIHTTHPTYTHTTHKYTYYTHTTHTNTHHTAHTHTHITYTHHTHTHTHITYTYHIYPPTQNTYHPQATPQQPGQQQPGQQAGTMDMGQWTDLLQQNAPGQNPQVSVLNQSAKLGGIPVYVVNGEHYPQTADGAMSAANIIKGTTQ